MTRLPLEVGVSALKNLALGVMVIPIGLAIVGVTVVFAVWAGDAGEALGYPLGAGFFAIGGGVYWVQRAWRGRPSDALLGVDGVTIEGGPHHRRSFAWSKLDPARCVVIERFKQTEKKESEGFALQLAETGAKPVDVALVDDAGDVASIRELHGAILARLGGERDAPEQPAGRATVLACAACNAPAAPSDDAHVTCTACGAEVAIPEDVRTRVRAALVLPRAEQRAAQTVARLLDQPGARRTALTLALSLAVIGAAWPLAVAAGVELWQRHELTWAKGLAVAALPFLLIADGFFLSRLRLVDRRALGTLAFRFGARPPACPGGPPTCHGCGAPLRAADTTVVRCVFCGMANVLGIDLRARASRTHSAATSLEDALRARGRERWRWRLRTVASLPVFALTALVLRAVW